MSADFGEESNRVQDHNVLERFSSEHRPAERILKKKRDVLDDWSKEFIAFTRLIILSTIDAHGQLYVSPRGGEKGFLKISNAKHLVFNDLPGNNLIESYRNIITNNNVGLLCIIPGREEILRIHGFAKINDLENKNTGTGLQVVISITEWYYHCGRSLRLSGAWDMDIITKNKDHGFSKRPKFVP
ncbi:hypothetical protein CWO84_23965 [Methylomonas sp. Kb3]|uniref:pyridoxamine 5'-phosphate oxidase family protein n=1 Tax=Methylomonas sp. Kb3 TaxID=1611544 RepID=UPI000C33CC7F|nr:pyridoxamine 5'-phosphate oxidase family protein [Methylomonas sp. Kb3]PKD38266.1 hypothetical protein CWO84_23965 [Methylomonas sp. Kb3]